MAARRGSLKNGLGARGDFHFDKSTIHTLREKNAAWHTLLSYTNIQPAISITDPNLRRIIYLDTVAFSSGFITVWKDEYARESATCGQFLCGSLHKCRTVWTQEPFFNLRYTPLHEILRIYEEYSGSQTFWSGDLSNFNNVCLDYLQNKHVRLLFGRRYDSLSISLGTVYSKKFGVFYERVVNWRLTNWKTLKKVETFMTILIIHIAVQLQLSRYPDLTPLDFY